MTRLAPQLGKCNHKPSLPQLRTRLLTFTGAFAEMYGGSNAVSGILTLAGGHIRLHDINTVFTVTNTGSIVGDGLLDQYNNGATLTNNGIINANTKGQTLTLAPANITGSGTFQATNGGVLAVSGLLTGSNANVHADTGTVQVDSGGISGTFASATGTGFTFTNNGNNYISNAVVNGNVTFGNAAFAEVYGGNAFNGTAAFTGGQARLHDINTTLTIGSVGSVLGYGTISQYNGGTTLTNNGAINANVNAQSLTVATGNFTNNGTAEATNGATLTVAPTVQNTGNIFVETGSAANFNGGVTQTAGKTRIDGTATLNSNIFTVQGGTVQGNGTLTGSINNTGGTVTAGSDTTAGHLSVTGNYTQSTGGAELVKLGGTGQGTSYDLFSVSSAATLQGTLDVQLVNNFNPFVGETFDFLTYANRTGAFDNITSLDSAYVYTVTYNDLAGVGTIHVDAVPETGTLVSLGLLLAGGAWSLRRKRQRNGKSRLSPAEHALA